MKLSGLIFDCDGVLVDTEEIAISLLVKLFTINTGITIEYEEGGKLFKGNTLDNNIEILNSMYHCRLSEDFADIYCHQLFAEFNKGLSPMCGVHEVIQNTSLKKSVASNSGRQKLSLVLKASGLAKYFGSNIVSSDDVSRPKPFPDVYLKASEILGLKSRECAAIEDTLTGVRSAISAGIQVVFYLNAEQKSNCFDQAQIASSELVPIKNIIEIMKYI